MSVNHSCVNKTDTRKLKNSMKKAQGNKSKSKKSLQNEERDHSQDSDLVINRQFYFFRNLFVIQVFTLYVVRTDPNLIYTVFNIVISLIYAQVFSIVIIRKSSMNVICQCINNSILMPIQIQS